VAGHRLFGRRRVASGHGLYNLAHRAEATIEFDDGRRIPVRAETLEGPQLDEA
jgi:hypothetical protein